MPGKSKLDGPMPQDELADTFGKIFLKKTGSEWGSLRPGDRVPLGKFWLQKQAQTDVKTRREYFVHDGVDGKEVRWYPYASRENDEVEATYVQHQATVQENQTTARIEDSRCFKYEGRKTGFYESRAKGRGFKMPEKSKGHCERGQPWTYHM